MNATAQPRVLVTLATYNERETLPELVAEILATLPTADILVVDDNSPDGTGRWCDEQARLEPRLRCLHRPGKLGLGTATIRALEYAIAENYDYVFNLDADGSHPPQYLPELLAALTSPRDEKPGDEKSGDDGPVDVAVASRYIAGGSIAGWPWRRHLLSQIVNRASRLGLRLPVRDCSGSYRCYRVARLRQVDFASLLSRGYAIEEEILWRLKLVGARMTEVPFAFVNRRAGASKINASEAASAAGILVRLALSEWLQRRR